MKELTMNPELNMYSTLPVRFSKHQGVFGKYAASEAATQSGWAEENGSSLFVPNTPITPSLNAPAGSMDLIKSELLTPDSLRTVSPDELLTADNSPLFDDLDMGEMQNWDSLFLDDAARAAGKQQQPPQQPQQQQQPQQHPVDAYAQDPLESLDVNVPFESFEDVDFGVLEDLPHSQPQVAPSVSASPMPASPAIGSPAIGSPALDTISLDSQRCSSVKPKPAASSAGKVTKESKRLDDLGITMYKRKPRTLPLKPVEVPCDGDDLAAKRAKNTEAARRSRARKLERMSQLEVRVRELLDENKQLKAEIAQLRGG